jgi:hypothetical protein
MRLVLAPSIAVLMLLPSAARADVIPPYDKPLDCPPGHQVAASHGGYYCQPPLPTSCPPGHLPRVSGSSAYCEPPPKEPCPPGSEWTSQSVDEGYCMAGSSCENGDCGPEATCVPASFCLAWTCFRCSMSRIVGLCRSDADCPQGGLHDLYDMDSPGGKRCIRSYYCDPKDKRVAADFRGPAPQAPLPIELSVLPERELPGCAAESCPAGQLCLPLSLCVGAIRSGQETAPVLGSCERGARCPANSVCARRFRCVEPRILRPTRAGKPVTSEPAPTGRLPPGAGDSPPAARRGGCAACALAPAEGGSLLLLAGGGALLAWLRLRRARARRGR